MNGPPSPPPHLGLHVRRALIGFAVKASLLSGAYGGAKPNPGGRPKIVLHHPYADHERGASVINGDFVGHRVDVLNGGLGVRSTVGDYARVWFKYERTASQCGKENCNPDLSGAVKRAGPVESIAFGLESGPMECWLKRVQKLSVL